MPDLTRSFAALADETRLSVVEHLLAHGEKPAGALAEVAPISAPAMSRHLKVLHQAGIVQRRVAGTHRYYSVRPEAMRAIADWTFGYRAFWEGSLDRLEQALKRDNRETRNHARD